MVTSPTPRVLSIVAPEEQMPGKGCLAQLTIYD
jgi:hypothetical protein